MYPPIDKLTNSASLTSLSSCFKYSAGKSRISQFIYSYSFKEVNSCSRKPTIEFALDDQI